MLSNHLHVRMAEKRIKSVSDLMDKSGLSRNGINKVYNDDLESVKLSTLLKLCDALDIKLSELIEYDPTQK